MRKIAKLLGLLAATAALAACAHQPVPSLAGSPPGFLWGVLHGFISLFTLAIHVIDPDVRIYAFPNNGGWYDCGFVVGCMFFYGGAGSRS